MTDEQFDILDELYFVISYKELSERLPMDSDKLNSELIGLFDKNWLRVFKNPNDTADYEKVNADILATSYLLASKAGLKAHNSA